MKLEERVARLEAVDQAHEERFDRIEKKIDDLNDKIDDLKDKLMNGFLERKIRNGIERFIGKIMISGALAGGTVAWIIQELLKVK